MPDHGERPAEEFERNLERELEAATYGNLPSPDYGSTLLEAAPAFHGSGGRKTNGGIMFLPNYKGPTVNIRAPKWTDNVFWIKAENYEAAQYIADAVFYHTGRDPFHFRDAKFRYPPVCLSTRASLTTREMCAAHVGKIAKGSALRKERSDYRACVKRLVLKAVTSPEAVQFLNCLRAIPPLVPREYGKLALDGNEAIEEETLSAAGDNETPMEVDTLSEQAILSLSPAASLDAASIFQVADWETTNLLLDLDISTAFVPSFAMDLDYDSESILRNEGQSLGVGCRHLGDKAEEYTIPSNFEGLLNTLDTEEEEAFRSTKWSDWEAIVSSQPKDLCHTFRH